MNRPEFRRLALPSTVGLQVVKDQRQKTLRLTDVGERPWSTPPDPIEVLHSIAFGGLADTDVATVADVHRGAAERLARFGGERDVS